MEHGVLAGHSAGLKVCSSALMCCVMRSHILLSPGVLGHGLWKQCPRIVRIYCVFLFFLSLFQWFDTAPSRTCPQCRNQVKPSPVHTCGTRELWAGVMP